ATERAVKQRDGYRCTVPGCRSARFLHVHHVLWRSRGGGHEMENLTTLCGGHHGAVHRGEIVITGKAPAIVTTRTLEVPHVGDQARGEQHDALLALTGLGFTKREASRAIAAAFEDDPESLEELVRAA